MAISGQQNIKIGQPNSAANSDSLYTAFTTIQNNFDQLFEASSPITSLVAGTGILISNTLANSYSIMNTGVVSLVAGRNVTITTLAGTPGSNGSLIINSTGTGGNGGGTVDSVGVASNTLVVSNSPITTSGNIDVEMLAIPGVAGSYRSANITVDGYGRIITVANGTSGGTVTSVGLAAGAGISIGGGPITTSGTMTVTNTGVTSIVAGTGVSINQSNGAVTINSTGGSNGGGGGTVTRVAVTSNTLGVTGSPIISNGTIDINLPANITTNVLTANIANAASIIGNQLQINAANSNVGITLTTAGATANTYGFVSKKSRGTVAAPTTALNGDTLLTLDAQAYTQFSRFQSGGSFQVTSNGSASTGNTYVPTIVTISSTSNTAIAYDMSLDDRGNLELPGKVSRHMYSNVSNPATDIVSRARGTDSGNIVIVQTGDTIARNITYGYTGNGTATIDGVSGLSFSGGTEFTVAGLPASSGQFIPSNYIIRTVNTGNVINTSTFTSAGNLSITGTYVGSAVSISGNITAGNAQFSRIVGSSVSTSGNISATGSVSASAITTTGSVSASAITATGAITATSAQLGQITGTSVTVSGNIIADGNITANTGSFFIGDGGLLSNISGSGNYSNSNVASYLPTYTGNVKFGGLVSTQTAVANTTAVIAAKIPIVVNGVTYFIMLTT